jgi:hypothetical protein
MWGKLKMNTLQKIGLVAVALYELVLPGCAVKTNAVEKNFVTDVNNIGYLATGEQLPEDYLGRLILTNGLKTCTADYDAMALLKQTVSRDEKGRVNGDQLLENCLEAEELVVEPYAKGYDLLPNDQVGDGIVGLGQANAYHKAHQANKQ